MFRLAFIALLALAISTQFLSGVWWNGYCADVRASLIQYYPSCQLAHKWYVLPWPNHLISADAA